MSPAAAQQVWDLRSKKLLMDLPGHADEVFRCVSGVCNGWQRPQPRTLSVRKQNQRAASPEVSSEFQPNPVAGLYLLTTCP